MLAQSTRVLPIDPNDVDPSIKFVLDAQTRKWGTPLLNHLLYARRRSIFRGVRAMWGGIDQSGLIDGALKALLNGRVAALNNCPF